MVFTTEEFLEVSIESWSEWDLKRPLCMVFTTEGFLEVTIESWPERDLNP